MNRRSIWGSCWISLGRVLLMLPSIMLMFWRLSVEKLFCARRHNSGWPSSVYTCEWVLFDAR